MSALRARLLLAAAGALALACGAGCGENVDAGVADADDLADLSDSDAGLDSSGDAATDAPPDTGLDAHETDSADAADAEDAADESDADAIGPHIPFEIRLQAEPPTPDTPFASEETTRYRAGDRLDADVANAVVAFGGRVAAIADGGLHLLDWNRDRFRRVDAPELAGVNALARATWRDGRLVVATDTAVILVGAADDVSVLPFAAAVESVAVSSGVLFAASGGELLRGTERGEGVAFEPQRITDGVTVTLVDGRPGVLAIAGPGGAWLADPGLDLVVRVSDAAIDAISLCPDGTLYAASQGRLLRGGEGGLEEVPTGPGALPTGDVRTVHCDHGVVVVGHAIGASVAAVPGLERWDHYQSRRWLMDDRVIGVSADRDRRWFATAGGVTRVDLVPRTLQAKGRIFLDLHDRYFWRLGGFSSAWAHTPSPWSREGLTLPDDDNDGQWTEEMIAALVFAAGATGDARYCAAARPAVRNMLMQVQLPCISFSEAGRDCGFITRSFVRDDEGALFESKSTQPNWHLVEFEGHRYYWKDDTSSDEYAGHYFGLPLYFDLCAGPGERAEIAAALALATDYLSANEYALIDLDGEPTSDGVWTRDYVASCVDGFARCDAADLADCASACFGGGFVNGAEILGHLLATWHVTGEQRFFDEYLRLLIDERYGEAVVFDHDALTFLNPAIENHVDHELAMLAFHTLVRYEPDRDRRAAWQEALLGVYESELDERNPLWAALVAGLTGVEHDRHGALQSLREYPMDLRYWRIDHSHRLDYTVRTERDRFGNPQLAEGPPPFDEQPVRWWDQSPYYLVSDGDGRAMRGPMAFSIAYWASRYYGLLDAPARPDHPLLDDAFDAIAHRGGGRLAPESTMPAYRNAIDAGADVLECDIHATSDGVLVCMHDDTVDRTTDGRGLVRDMRFDELRALDAGYRFARDGDFPYRGVGVVVPTLQEVLAEFPDTPWTLEIKQATPSIARQVVDAVEHAHRTGDVAIASFVDATIAEVRAANPDIVTALTATEMVRFVSLDPSTPGEYRPPGLLVQAPYGGGAGDILAPERLALAERLGMRVQVWTVNEESELRDAIERGAHGVFTDDPALLMRVLNELGVR